MSITAGHDLSAGTRRHSAQYGSINRDADRTGGSIDESKVTDPLVRTAKAISSVECGVSRIADNAERRPTSP